MGDGSGDDAAAAAATSWQDWFTLAFVIGSITVLMIGTASAFIRRTYPPLQAKNVPLLIVMGIAGVIHILAILVYNAHFSELLAIEHLSCVTWNYWLPYFFGLCPWFIGVFVRLITYGSIYSGHLSDLGYECIRKYKWLCAILISLPLFVILILLTVFRGSSIDLEDGRCHSVIEFKATVTAWILIIGLGLCISTFIMKRDIVRDYHNEFRPLVQIIIIGTIVLCVNGTIVFFELHLDAYWRGIATCNIAFLHVFSFARIAAFDLISAMINDERYAQTFRKGQREQEINLLSIDDVKTLLPEVFNDFIQYCSENRPMIDLENGHGIVKPLYLVNCYTEIIKWKGDFDQSEFKKHRVEKLSKIVNKYFYDYQNCEYIHLSGDMLNKFVIETETTRDSFREIENWIVETLDSFFGKDYLCTDIRDRVIYEGLVITQLSNIKSQKLHQRTKQAHLTTVVSLNAEHIFSEGEDDQALELEDIEQPSIQPGENFAPQNVNKFNKKRMKEYTELVEDFAE